MKSSSPLVSIVIPVYNGRNYLKEAIDSALEQTYQNIEVIVINDGSTDNGKTEQIAKSYGKKIRYFLKTNGGVATALNMGIKKMRGEWFSWLSHDDVYYPTKIADQISYINRHQDTKILYTDYDLINNNGAYIGSISVKPKNHTNLQIRLLESYPVNGCTTLVAKECLDAVGGFDVNLPSTQDYDLWFRLSEMYNFVYLPIKSIKSRIHDEQGSNSTRYEGEADRLYKKYINRVNFVQILNELKGESGKWLQNLTIRFKNYGYGGAAKAIFQKKIELGFKSMAIDFLISKYISLPDSFTKKLYTHVQVLIRFIFKIKQTTIRNFTRI